MPPDRNSLGQARADVSVGSPADSVASSLVASSSTQQTNHNIRSSAKQAPSLERGKACLTCRSRKVKCDGATPSCSACRRSAQAKGDNPDTIVCDYDTPEQRRRPVGGGKVWGLETKIKDLEAKIAELSKENEQQKTVIAAAGLAEQAQMHFGGRIDTNHSMAVDDNDATALNAMPPLPSMDPLTSTNGTSSINDNQIPPPPTLLEPPRLDTLPEFAPTTTLELPRIDNIDALRRQQKPYGDISNSTYFSQSFAVERQHFPTPTPLSLPQQSPLLDLFYPNWPRTLPSPQLVHRLVDAFFSKSHLVSVMINKPRLMRNLQLPPTHSDFPTTALLHGIIAIASNCVSDDVWQGEDRYWGPDETPADWHARQAKMGIESSWVNDDHYLEVAQTAVLCCFLSYQNARFGEVWLECAQATRLAVPLGINHLRSCGPGKRPKWSKHLKTSMLQPTEDEDELFERSITFWFGEQGDFAIFAQCLSLTLIAAFTCDRFASASTGWATSLDEEDVTTLLPSPTGNKYPVDHLNESPLSVHNPHFLTSHPSHLVQTLQLYLNSHETLKPAGSASAIGVGPNNGKIHMSESPFASIDPRESVLFKQLDQDLIAFRNSIPREYQHVSLQAHTDALISLVHAIPHASTILLHEPFVTMSETDPSMTKCVNSARAILDTIFTLYSSSFELSLLVPFINFTWAVAGRTLVRQLALKSLRKQTSECDELRSSVNTIISAMKSGRTKLGLSTSQALEALLRCPAVCLPAFEMKHHGFGFAPVIDASGQTVFLPNKSGDPKTPSEALKFFIESRPRTPVQNMADVDPWMMTNMLNASNGDTSGVSSYDQISQFLLEAETAGPMTSILEGAGLQGSSSLGTASSSAGLGPSPLASSTMTGASSTFDTSPGAESSYSGGLEGLNKGQQSTTTSPPFIGGARITEMEDDNQPTQKKGAGSWGPSRNWTH
ncbi:hypothetical protein OIO90_001768 [Microbotryomycetes sp. JL221]|nr:hypothetical protein OIO90_001768 [Microbotryomycetes sp. JL221]